MEYVDYQRYIEDNRLVGKGKSGYFVHWVKRFSRLNFSSMLSNEDKIVQFRESLEVDEN